MVKYKTLKEIHEFLIENNMLHRERHYDIKDQKLLHDFLGESNKEKPHRFCETPEIRLPKTSLDEF